MSRSSCVVCPPKPDRPLTPPAAPRAGRPPVPCSVGRLRVGAVLVGPRQLLRLRRVRRQPLHRCVGRRQGGREGFQGQEDCSSSPTLSLPSSPPLPPPVSLPLLCVRARAPRRHLQLLLGRRQRRQPAAVLVQLVLRLGLQRHRLHGAGRVDGGASQVQVRGWGGGGGTPMGSRAALHRNDKGAGRGGCEGPAGSSCLRL